MKAKIERLEYLKSLYTNQCMSLSEYEEYLDLGYELSLEDPLMSR